MVEPNIVIPQFSTSSSSFDDQIFRTNINSSFQQKSPPLKKTRGRPVGSKNRPKIPLTINQINEHLLKPILIQVPNNFDVIEALVQFAHRYQVSITVLSASGSISCASLRHTLFHACGSILYGPFTLISLTGTYSPFGSPSITDLNIRYSFKISFSSYSRQSFIGIVGGKVIAANNVTIVATTFKNFEIPKASINDGN